IWIDKSLKQLARCGVEKVCGADLDRVSYIRPIDFWCSDQYEVSSHGHGASELVASDRVGICKGLDQTSGCIVEQVGGSSVVGSCVGAGGADCDVVAVDGDGVAKVVCRCGRRIKNCVQQTAIGDIKHVRNAGVGGPGVVARGADDGLCSRNRHGGSKE